MDTSPPYPPHSTSSQAQVASLRNKANFPFHQPDPFIGFQSRQTPPSVTVPHGSQWSSKDGPRMGRAPPNPFTVSTRSAIFHLRISGRPDVLYSIQLQHHIIPTSDRRAQVSPNTPGLQKCKTVMVFSLNVLLSCKMVISHKLRYMQRAYTDI